MSPAVPRRAILAVIVSLVAFVPWISVAAPPAAAASVSFTDTQGHPFAADIEWLRQSGISGGCTPTRFCPDAPVNREQMASLLARALGLPSAGRDYFTDDGASIHQADINRVAAAGISGGCAAGRFCPRSTLTRQEMASFLVRAYDVAATNRDYFTDDRGSIHQADINRLAASGITGGCAPGRFCPTGVVTRGQMAAFLHRAIADPIAAPPVPPPSPTPPPPPSGAGWVTVVNDQFNSGGVPGHWNLYSGRYGSGARNCPTPSHVSVSGGYLHLLMKYESSGKCGAAWYTAGMQIDSEYGGIDQRVTVRFRVVNNGSVSSHRIIPMRWPASGGPSAGEEDYCESNPLNQCMTFLHNSGKQIWYKHTFDQTKWHTFRAERRNYVVRIYIDDMSTPVWTYTGNSTTLPATFKRTVLQQECHPDGCPSGTSGTQDIQIDWITIENPA